MSGLRRIALGLCGLLFFAIIAFVGQRVAERGRFTGSYSSYGAGPKGTRALYLLAERMGLAPARWSQDLAALPDRGGVLVALGACDTEMARPLSRYENQELADWIERGGVLLVGGARHYLPARLGVSFAAEADCKAAAMLDAADDDGMPPIAIAPEDAGVASDAGVGGDAGVAAVAIADAGILETVTFADPAWVWAIASDKVLDGIDTVPMYRPGRLVLEPDADARVLLVLSGMAPADDSAPQTASVREAGVMVRHGKGRVIALASATMLQNQTLATSGGGVLFARLMNAYGGRGPVLFDEYHLGVGERRSLMRYLRQVGALPYMLQVLLVALLLLWRGGARFGGVREPLATSAPTASFVSALGGLFARAGDAPSALSILGKQALARIAAHHHLPHMAADALAAALAETGRGEAADAVRRIIAIEAAGARDAAQLAPISRALDDEVARACRAR